MRQTYNNGFIGKDVQRQLMGRAYNFLAKLSWKILINNFKFEVFVLSFLTIGANSCHRCSCDMYFCGGSQKLYVCRV